MASATLIDLPDELLLQVMHGLPTIPHSRRGDLSSLSLTCKRIRPVTLEPLLISPIVHLYKIPSLLKLYFARPDLAAKVSTLELTTQCMCEDPGEVGTQSCVEDLKCNRPIVEGEFLKDCTNAIEGFATTPERKQECLIDLQGDDYPHAALAILLATLPRLEELLLGTSSLKHMLFLRSTLHPDRNKCSQGEIACTQPSWMRGYIDDIMAQVAPRLQSLELPFTWSACGLHDAFGVRSLTAFTSLKHLTLPHKAAIVEYSHDYTQFVPDTLEVLTIFLQDIRYRSSRAITDLLRALALARNTLPRLRHIELHSDWTREMPEKNSGKPRDLRKWVSQASANKMWAEWAKDLTDDKLQIHTHYELGHTFDIGFNAAEYMGRSLGLHHYLARWVVNVLEVRGRYEELVELRDEAMVEESAGYQFRVESRVAGVSSDIGENCSV